MSSIPVRLGVRAPHTNCSQRWLGQPSELAKGLRDDQGRVVFGYWHPARERDFVGDLTHDTVRADRCDEARRDAKVRCVVLRGRPLPVRHGAKCVDCQPGEPCESGRDRGALKEASEGYEDRHLVECCARQTEEDKHHHR